MNKPEVPAQVIVMCGISGSGKTHYALQLEEEGFHRLSTDAIIWDKIGDKLFSLPKEEQKKLFANSRVEIFNKLYGLIEKGEKIVVDATHCKRSARDGIRKLCEKAKIKPIFIYCYTKKDILWNRLSQRKGSGPDDLIVTKEELDSYWLGFERPQNDETDIIFKKT